MQKPTYLKLLTAVVLWAALGLPGAATGAPAELPSRLGDTGLYAAGTTTVPAENLPYSPQYPLWSDGASKRRWLYLPPGSVIDASDPDAWEFPVGTRLWKEFSHGRPVETRFIERLADKSWRYATYVWNADGTDALLAPATGLPDHVSEVSPGGRYPIPSRDDCLACHEGTAVPVLGFNALQLSPDRDSQAVHAESPGPASATLSNLVSQGRISNLPSDFLKHPPRIDAASPLARSALGYLHANCGHCHNSDGPLALLDLDLAQSVAGKNSGNDKVLHTLLGQQSDFHIAGASQRVAPGDPAQSVLTLRMRAREPLTQMPPLGTRMADFEAIALIERWISQQM